MIFPWSTKLCPCPFPGCLGSSHTCNGFHLHFRSRYWDYRISILEEHPNPIPRYERCGIQVPEGRINNRHYVSDKCKQGEERRIRCKTLQRCFEASKVLFQINTDTLPLLEDFPYLGWTIAYNNSDWEEVYQNLRKVRRWWEMVERVLERTGATVWSQGAMYKSLAQLVLLYSR